MEPLRLPTVLSDWAITVRRECRWKTQKSARAKSCGKDARWKSPKNGLSHLAWKSRQLRGIPTFPQLRRLREINLKPDISFATKSGHFNLLPTAVGGRVSVSDYGRVARHSLAIGRMI